MSHHTSESLICELSEKVRRTAERHPKQKLTVQAILKTASDRTKPVENRISGRFLPTKFLIR